MTPCQRQRAACTPAPEVDRFCPSCAPNGDYEAVWSHPLSRITYCRHPVTGQEIPGTRQTRQPGSTDRQRYCQQMQERERKHTRGRARHESPGIILDVEKLAFRNRDFRRRIYSSDHDQQLVLMTLPPRQEIGLEHHRQAQFMYVFSGRGLAVVGRRTRDIGPGTVIMVPSDVPHNVINLSSSRRLRLMTLYTPPKHHRDARTKHEAEQYEKTL